MNKIDIEICACNKCIMLGAMDMREHIESLNDLLENPSHVAVEVKMDKKLCTEGDDVSPLVIINGERFEKAKSEIVMEKIIQLMKGM